MTTAYMITKYSKKELRLNEAIPIMPPMAQKKPPNVKARIGAMAVHRISCGYRRDRPTKRAMNQRGMTYPFRTSRPKSRRPRPWHSSHQHGLTTCRGTLNNPSRIPDPRSRRRSPSYPWPGYGREASRPQPSR